MNGCCNEVIEPSLKMGRIITLLKYVATINFILIFADLFIMGTGYFFLLFIQTIVLLIGISSKYFSHFLLFILFSFFNIFWTFQTLGEWFQKGFYKNDSSFEFCILVFLIVFEIFSTFVIFQAYKQAKQEYRIKFGYAPQENELGENLQNAQDMNNGQDFNNDNHNNNNNNDNGGFVPFQGRDFAVGGN